MPAQSSKIQTQWTAQFLVAAELTSRGYQVSFSLGNAKFTDIQVETPDGKQFSVDVKGRSSKSYWRVKQREHNKNQYYILVHVPRSKQKDVLLPKEAQYFILSSDEMEKELELSQKSREQENKIGMNERRDPVKEFSRILSFGQARNHENRWDKLPE